MNEQLCQRIENSAHFRELVASRQRFAAILSVIMLVIYVGFILLIAFAPGWLGTPLHAPQLAPLGYELLGGRLLAAGEGPVAQFMYQNAAGARLTLYVRRAAPAGVMPADTLTAFQVAREGDVEVFYWVENGFGYALSGRVARPQLQAVAEAVYHQLTAPPAAASAP